MDEQETYPVFISHAWRFSEDYFDLSNMLEQIQGEKIIICSRPRHDSILNPNRPRDREDLLRLLEQQIKPVCCVLIISRMYACDRQWIDQQIRIAQKYGKPIIVIKSYAWDLAAPAIQKKADVVVEWETGLLIDTIRHLYHRQHLKVG